MNRCPRCGLHEDDILLSKDINIKCIVCGRSLSILREVDSLNDCPPETDMWDGAGVHEFIPGYGSKHDMKKLIVGICDDCLDKALEYKEIVEQKY